MEALEPFIDEVLPEEEEEFNLSVMVYGFCGVRIGNINHEYCKTYRGTCDLYIFR